MGSRKVKADCRADTRGGPWAGIPVCVINSAAFRDCSVHARAILIELVARMNGCNNGKIAVSQREFAALRCHARKVVRGIVELWEHGAARRHRGGQMEGANGAGVPPDIREYEVRQRHKRVPLLDAPSKIWRCHCGIREGQICCQCGIRGSKDWCHSGIRVAITFTQNRHFSKSA